MPQMSKIPFMFVSIVIVSCMLLWLVNGFFNLKIIQSSSVKSTQNRKSFSKWPLN